MNWPGIFTIAVFTFIIGALVGRLLTLMELDLRYTILQEAIRDIRLERKKTLKNQA